MLKRPLHPQFNAAVLAGHKFTTIRSKPWPVEVPIMLYNWAGAAYRSNQTDVAVVKVTGYWPIKITQCQDGKMTYEAGMNIGVPLHQTEGFDSAAAMDSWFRLLVKPGQTITKYLMRFHVSEISTPIACGRSGTLDAGMLVKST